MGDPRYVALDWGTSSFRLWLVGRDGAVLAERRSGEGMTQAAKAGFAAVLDGHLSALGVADAVPVLACGMVGARQGWVEAGYLDTPAPLGAIATAAVRVPGTARDIRVLPGLAQRDRDRPDVMRGEETQLMGALVRLGPGRHRVCMPGTHSKWVRLDGDIASGFSTFMTGELFDVLSRQTILAHSVGDGGRVAADHPAFLDAVEQVRTAPAEATNHLFSIRAGQLLHGTEPLAGRARLSGTLIGLEIAAALRDDGDAVCLVASGPLAALYRAALAVFSVTPVDIDADDAVRHGLAMAADLLWPQGPTP
ncbi:2-dehydro-3-deoxygalactonokinase [Ensifer soli]|uniref:2-dehydro-3-deoxygalactonokinase n=1 Tax=Ciceribacter sp. sgz301302 TaxID=3342379 RepID=UPI0035B9651C